MYVVDITTRRGSHVFEGLNDRILYVMGVYASRGMFVCVFYLGPINISMYNPGKRITPFPSNPHELDS